MVTERQLDIGHDHVLTLITPEGGSRPVSADVAHLTPDGKPCTGWIPFDVPAHERLSPERKWQVESWDPLTLSPSLACGCGDHGFVREGRWVPA
jgi:hypothetical protein